MNQHPDPPTTDRLVDAVCRGTSPTTGDDERAAVHALYAILAAGDPVSPDRLAESTRWTMARAREFLERLPNTQRDEHGDLVGFGGLTLEPTPHRIVVDGQVRYAWCAWDTLFLPAALGRTIDVASPCPRTGRVITLTVAPARIVDRDPTSAVLSFLQPDAVDPTDLRASFCENVHFLADPEAARGWTHQGSNRLILELDDGFELGRRLLLQCCGPADATPWAVRRPPAR